MRLMAGIWNALHTNNISLTAIPSLVHFYCYLPIKNYYLYWIRNVPPTLLGPLSASRFIAPALHSQMLFTPPPFPTLRNGRRSMFALYKASQLLSAIKIKVVRQLFLMIYARNATYLYNLKQNEYESYLIYTVAEGLT